MKYSDILYIKPKGYPNKQWLLYLKEVKGYEEYGYSIGEELGFSGGYYKMKIIGKFGGTEEVNKKNTFGIGNIIHLLKEVPKVGYGTKDHSNYLDISIKEIKDNPYIGNKNQIWLVEKIIGYTRLLNTILNNNGIIDKGLIEYLFETSEGKYFFNVPNNKGYGILYNGDIESQQFGRRMAQIKDGDGLTNKTIYFDGISCLDALKFFGLPIMEDAIERTNSGIPKEDSDRYLNYIKAKKREEKLNLLL